MIDLAISNWSLLIGQCTHVHGWTCLLTSHDISSIYLRSNVSHNGQIAEVGGTHAIGVICHGYKWVSTHKEIINFV